MRRRERECQTKIAAVGAPATEHHAREIATCGVYAVVSHLSILCNCFLILRGIVHEDFKKSIFLEPIICFFSFGICASNYSVGDY